MRVAETKTDLATGQETGGLGEKYTNAHGNKGQREAEKTEQIDVEDKKVIDRNVINISSFDDRK